MNNLIPLECLAFEYTVKGGIFMKVVKHDVYTLVKGKMIVSDRKLGVININRELELMELLRNKKVYATRDDAEFYYNGK